jgi:U1 small nuclear ribonucleoprotein
MRIFQAGAKVTSVHAFKMTQYLPPNLLALFAPRDPIHHLEPLDTLPWEKKPWPYSGISKYLSLFEVRNHDIYFSVHKTYDFCLNGTIKSSTL